RCGAGQPGAHTAACSRGSASASGEESAGERGAPRAPRGAPRVGGCGGPSRGPPREQMNDQIVFLLQLVITGVAVGAVYSLMALGFVLIYKASTVVNFGPGELVLFGAYVAWATILNMKLHLAVALPLTLVVAILLGLVIERGVLRPLIGEPIIAVIMV